MFLCKTRSRTLVYRVNPPLPWPLLVFLIVSVSAKSVNNLSQFPASHCSGHLIRHRRVFWRAYSCLAREVVLPVLNRCIFVGTLEYKRV